MSLRTRSVMANQAAQSPASTQLPAASDRGRSTGDLASRIRSRIEQRLGDRIRGLTVKVEKQQVELGGRCSTYYSKQLAQHAALGVIEDEMLSNAIQVGVGS